MQQEIQNCTDILKKGGIILYPTDTIWGIGCDATNPIAIEKIHLLKGSSTEKSMLILCSSINEVNLYVERIPKEVNQLIKNTTKPLTIIYPNAKNLPNILLAQDNSIGIRIPNHDFCQNLLAAFGKPIVSTSANFSGESSPKSFKGISEKLIQKVDYCVSVNMEQQHSSSASKLVKITEDNEIVVLRE